MTVLEQRFMETVTRELPKIRKLLEEIVEEKKLKKDEMDLWEIIEELKAKPKNGYIEIDKAFKHYLNLIQESLIIIEETIIPRNDCVIYTLKDTISGDNYKLKARLNGDELQVFNEEGINVITELVNKLDYKPEFVFDLQFGWK